MHTVHETLGTVYIYMYMYIYYIYMYVQLLSWSSGCGTCTKSLSDIVHTQSLSSLKVLVSAGTLETQEPMRDVLHYIESDSLSQ